MYSRSPAWSIQGKKKENKVARTPSPFHYQPKKVNAPHQPSWKIGTQKRNQTKKQIKPDPGSYNAKCLFETVKYGRFDKQKKLKYKGNQIPHSSQYSPNHQYLQKSSPGQIIGCSNKKQSVEKTPGPGTYMIKQKTLENSRVGLPFTKQNRFLTNQTQDPSPATYSPNQMFNQKSVSFTKQSKFPNREKQKSNSPGPACYNSQTLFAKNSKGFSMVFRHQASKNDEKPGPGAYDPQFTGFSTSPQHTFGSKHLTPQIPDTPGPLDYRTKTLHSTNCFSIGKQERKTVDLKRENPGPGAYSIKTPFKNTPNYSIGTSTINQRQNFVPGPGNYDPHKQFIQSRPKSAKIGNSKRNTSEKKLVPGPGQYETNIIRPQSAKTVFGKTQRMKQKVDTIPGPGQYNSQTIFGTRNKLLLLR